jgi:hypothetical protein
MRRFRGLGLIIACLTLGAFVAPLVSAQSAAANVVDLAAMTLDSSVLPNGYDFQRESTLTAEQVVAGAKGIDAKALTSAGFQTMYASVYQSEDGKRRIRSYVSAWTSEDAATKGFALLEDETKTMPGGTFKDAAGTTGQEPREITTGTYTDAGANKAKVTTIDTSFREKDVLAGVAVETLDGSTPDSKVAASMAKTLQQRVATVQSGKSPSSVDLALGERALALTADGQPVQIGFLTSTEAETLYGLSGSSLHSFKSSYVSAISLGSTQKPLPLVSASVTSFTSSRDAQTVVAQANELFPTLDQSSERDGLKVSGADKVVAFAYANELTHPDKQDSYRIVLSAGANLVVIDVVGAPDADTAANTGETLAKAQVGCLSKDAKTPCQAPALPKALTGR